jgi:transposase
MRRVREILRLVLDAGVPVRAVAQQLRVAPSTVRETLRRFEASGVEWPLPAELTDGAWETQLLVRRGRSRVTGRVPKLIERRSIANLSANTSRCRSCGTSISNCIPIDIDNSRFCERYRSWKARLTDEIREAHIFVAVMGASSLSFAWASWTESLPDWVDAHVRAFAYFGLGPPADPRQRQDLGDQGCLYDPHVNRS